MAKRLVQSGHEVVFITAGYKGCKPWVERDGFTVVRVGGRFSVYWQAYKYYKKHLTTWPDLVIEEVNTVPFFTRLYVRQKHMLFIHQLAREIWFYQMPLPISLVGYLLEPLYLRFLAKGSPTVVTVSESTKKDLMHHGFKAKNIHLISEGIEEEPLRVLLPKAVPVSEAPVLLAFGAVRPMKRTLEAVRAFEMVKRSCKGAILVIAGDISGAYGKRVAKAAAKSPFATDIHITGAVSDSQKLELFQLASILLVTSVKEGWGLVVTEANSQGTPAVVYNVDGLRDAVQNGVTGIVTAQNTPASMAQSILRLLKDPSQYESIRQKAWEWSKQITFEKSYEQLSKLIFL